MYSSIRSPLAVSAVLSLLAAGSEATLKVVDTVGDVCQDVWNQAKNDGFEVAIPRGVFEACSEGGALDPNFLTNVERASAAGFSSIETYLYPCSSNAYPCKTPAEQVALVTDAISKANAEISRIWIQVGAPGEACPQEWNMGQAGNADYLLQLIQAVLDAGFYPGVYSSFNSWEVVFGSPDFVVDSTVPLWFAHWNELEDTAIELPFGGWNTALAHQYAGPATSPNGEFELSVFETEAPEVPEVPELPCGAPGAAPCYSTTATWVTVTPTPTPTPTDAPTPPTPTYEPAPPAPTDDIPVPSDANMSEEGIELLKVLEGFRADYYWLFGEKHIGYGHNCDQRFDCDDLIAPITEEQADELLRSDLNDYEACTCELPNASALNLNQYSALVSFAFNSGCGGLEQYTASYLEESNFDGVCNDLPGLNTLGGYLETRRAQESDLCFTPTEVMSGC
ncbi:hypothetical protein FQN54_001198 [Arachnomyces sp. PD_36]|nr:hypothetical protein FQN54_001198 [Arachnomyces sp. PD_36]